jgi:N-acetylmuramic acid 6-phosphate etherase
MGLASRIAVLNLMKMSTPEQEAEAFLRVAPQFQLGALTTEQAHPKTRALSRWAREDLPRAVRVLKEVDLDALGMLAEYAETLEPLARSIDETLRRGCRIFLCGCGATGRLSISLEIFARHGFLGKPMGDAVVAFMAGGDAALVRSIERFEDYPAHGARQLRELGFMDGDLLIATTEGGETPFVIGAAEEAARISNNRPYFLYCNPDEQLCRAVERSRRLVENAGIEKINLTVGPMAITGSTRMQASTVLMAGVGWAMGCREEPGRIGEVAGDFREWVEETDFGFLAESIELEEAAYRSGKGVMYEPNGFGITVLTDTTERSPTFSLAPFENSRCVGEMPSHCYLHLVGAEDAGAAWRCLLGRDARILDWEEVKDLAGMETLSGFDFSDEGFKRREALGAHERFVIENRMNSLQLRLGEWRHDVAAGGRDMFSRHLILKLLLNTHSTLVMGRLGRFEGNVMTWVRPMNNKLIDRAVRYVGLLLEQRGEAVPEYDEVVRALFGALEKMERDEAVVLKTADMLAVGNGGGKRMVDVGVKRAEVA